MKNVEMGLSEMKRETQRIPTHDYLGRRVKVGEKAVIFSKHGTHYEGKIEQIGGKRWFVVDPGMKIGGIGNCFLLKI